MSHRLCRTPLVCVVAGQKGYKTSSDQMLLKDNVVNWRRSMGEKLEIFHMITNMPIRNDIASHRLDWQIMCKHVEKLWAFPFRDLFEIESCGRYQNKSNKKTAKNHAVYNQN